MNYHTGRLGEHRGNIIPCIGLSLVLFLILGILPILPSTITQILRPAEIVLCLVFSATIYYSFSASNKWLLVFMTYYTIVFLIHPISKTSFMGWASLELFSAFALLMISKPWSKNEIRYLLTVAAIASAVFAYIVFRDNPNFLHEKSYEGIHFMQTTVNDNTAAFSIVPGTICSVFLLFFSSSNNHARVIWSKVLYLVCAGFCFNSLFCIGARSAFFSALAGTVLIFIEWANNRKTNEGRAFSWVVVVFVLIAVFIIGTNITQGTHSARLFDIDNMTDGTGRDILADQAWGMIRKKPLFGGGFDYWVMEKGDPLGTHNTFLTHMVQGGYCALLIVIGFLVSTIYDLSKSRSFIPFAFIVEMFAHTFTESDFNYYVYIPLIISFCLVRYAAYHKCKIIDIVRT